MTAVDRFDERRPPARVSSPAPLRSTLTTSAPRSARIWAAQGPARMRAISSTRSPAKARINQPSLAPAVSGRGGKPPFLWLVGGCCQPLVSGLGERTSEAAVHYPINLARFVKFVLGRLSMAVTVKDSGSSEITSFFGDMLQTIAERGRAPD